MLPTFLLLATLAARPPFLWSIEGMGSPNSLTLKVTVREDPFGLTPKFVDVKTITLEPVSTDDDPKPRSIHPLRVETTEKWGMRAWFTPPDRRFHLIVILSNGSIHRVDIYRIVPYWGEPRIRNFTPLIAPLPPRWT